MSAPYYSGDLLSLFQAQLYISVFMCLNVILSLFIFI